MAEPPYKRLWGPQNEHEYQTFMAFDPAVRDWRNAFTRNVGGPPQTEGGTFDYRAAFLGGNRPMPVQGDPVPHWGSQGKAVDHPTAWKQTFMTQFGVDPDQAMQSGQITPEQQQFINDQLRRDMLVQALTNGTK